jgi:hypothetical protein
MDEIEQTQEPILTDEIITTDSSNQELKDTILKLTEKIYEECEWCYQFDEDEAQVFAWTNEDMEDEEPTVNFTIGNTEGAYVSFTKDGKRFKLFARELSDEGKQLREFQTQQNESLKKDIENASKNKEA